MVRIVQFTDVHFGAQNEAAVEAAAAFAHESQADAVLVTGDITQRGLMPEFHAAVAWLKTLPEPWLCCPGNHDTAYYNVFWRIAGPWKRFDSTIGDGWKKGLRAPGLAVESLNTARGIQLRTNWSKGKIDLDDARAAAARLQQVEPETLRVIALHHPLMEVLNEPITSEVREGGKAVTIFAQAEVDLVLTGHLHVPFATPLPCHDRKTYSVGGSTLSLRERGVSPGFNVIDADAETILVKAMGWTGSHFEAERTWALPRRRREDQVQAEDARAAAR